MKYLQQNFNIQSIRKTETILLLLMWLLEDWLTKVKTQKYSQFVILDPKMGKNFVPISTKWGVFSYIRLKFLLQYFYNHYLLLLNAFLKQNMKKPIGNTSFFVFFTTLNLIRDVKPFFNFIFKTSSYFIPSNESS